MKQCECCGKEYDSDNKRFCSIDCWHKSKCGSNNPKWKARADEIRICVGCGAKFHPVYARDRKYCSIECYLHTIKENALVKVTIPIDKMRGEKHPRWIGKKFCKVCGKELFERTERRSGCCSKECVAKSRKHGGKVRAKGVIEKALAEGKEPFFICKVCGKKVECNPSIAQRRLYCSRPCQRIGTRKSVSLKCAKCGCQFSVPRSAIENAKKNGTRRRFCSRKCYLSFYGPSHLEELVSELLIILKLPYEAQYRLGKKKRFYDFFVPSLNLLIEVDSEFYHYSEWARKKGQRERDKEKDQLALESGFQLLRLREDRIKNDLAGIGNELLAMQSYQRILDWA